MTFIIDSLEKIGNQHFLLFPHNVFMTYLFQGH